MNLKSLLPSKARILFQQAYSLPFLPSEIEVEFSSRPAAKNFYLLSYPYKNPLKNQAVVRPYSCLYIDRYILKSQSPLIMVQFVSQLRERGLLIAMCREELEKANALEARIEKIRNFSSPQDIINRFMAVPTDFEKFCADLFSHMGYRAVVTPPSNDGGYDIRLFHGKETTLVECKCYSTAHKVDRPLIQKLVGANRKECADHMLFVTTSSFTYPAIEFARQTKVGLIDGTDLISLIRRYQPLHPETYSPITEADWRLNASDLMSHVPRNLIGYL
ncbi:MAG: restriction endonuclease [Lachnospiraceae bacterium]|nr:restriction endonuclease [Robinsoniella sp.]MDY3767751.1 restriction endonuclease [Lachnospiraceae bacterium]